MEQRRSLVVELEDRDGRRGLGESAPFEAPFYSGETLSSARACLSEWLLPRIVGQAVATAQALDDRLTAGVVGNAMARAGVETAWWDLRAQQTGVPMSHLVTRRLAELGVVGTWLERRDRVECGVALGIPDGGDVQQLRHEVHDALRHGYRRLKLKITPGWDEEPVRVARDVVQQLDLHIPITVDANGAYDLRRDFAALRRLDDLWVLFIEQPVPADALWDLRELSQSFRTPICIDESLTSERVARQILAMGGPQVWNIKVQRVGGLEQSCRIYARAAEAGVRVWGGTMPETGLGAQAMLALGCHGGFVFPSDLEPSERWYGAGIDLVELVMDRNGTMPVPDRRPSVDLAARALLVFERC
jgi:O-succinylbenzoate synthase